MNLGIKAVLFECAIQTEGDSMWLYASCFSAQLACPCGLDVRDGAMYGGGFSV